VLLGRQGGARWFARRPKDQGKIPETQRSASPVPNARPSQSESGTIRAFYVLQRMFGGRLFLASGEHQALVVARNGHQLMLFDDGPP